MELNQWTKQLHDLYDTSVAKYQAGQRGEESYFDLVDTAFLASIGLKPINLYDYVEDFVKYGEPDWDTFLLIASARRDYFLYEQHGQLSTKEIDAGELPPKTASLGGIEWLPRIVAKAQCFLGGGLCHDIMYGCGGDRNFLKEHRLHPADFLRMVWAARGDEQKVLHFVRGAA